MKNLRFSSLNLSLIILFTVALWSLPALSMNRVEHLAAIESGEYAKSLADLQQIQTDGQTANKAMLIAMGAKLGLPAGQKPTIENIMAALQAKVPVVAPAPVAAPATAPATAPAVPVATPVPVAPMSAPAAPTRPGKLNIGGFSNIGATMAARSAAAAPAAPAITAIPDSPTVGGVPTWLVAAAGGDSSIIDKLAGNLAEIEALGALKVSAEDFIGLLRMIKSGVPIEAVLQRANTKINTALPVISTHIWPAPSGAAAAPSAVPVAPIPSVVPAAPKGVPTAPGGVPKAPVARGGGGSGGSATAATGPKIYTLAEIGTTTLAWVDAALANVLNNPNASVVTPRIKALVTPDLVKFLKDVLVRSVVDTGKKDAAGDPIVQRSDAATSDGLLEKFISGFLSIPGQAGRYYTPNFSPRGFVEYMTRLKQDFESSGKVRGFGGFAKEFIGKNSDFRRYQSQQPGQPAVLPTTNPMNYVFESAGSAASPATPAAASARPEDVARAAALLQRAIATTAALFDSDAAVAAVTVEQAQQLDKLIKKHGERLALTDAAANRRLNAWRLQRDLDFEAALSEAIPFFMTEDYGAIEYALSQDPDATENMIKHFNKFGAGFKPHDSEAGAQNMAIKMDKWRRTHASKAGSDGSGGSAS